MTELLTVLKAECDTLRIVVNEGDLTLTAVSACAVFLFQKIGKLLNCRVLFLIEVLHTELAVNKACAAVDLCGKCFIDLNTVHNRTFCKFRLWLFGCRFSRCQRFGITKK